MSKSRSDMPLFSIGAIIAINQNRLSDALNYIESLILNLPEKKLITELDSIFTLINFKSHLLVTIPMQYHTKILIAAIKNKNQNIIELLLKEKLIGSMTADEFCTVTALLFKNRYNNMAEFVIQIRKNYALKTIENELAILILLIQIDDFPEKYACIRYLHRLGISPMKRFIKNNQPYTLAIAAITAEDKKLLNIYLDPDFLNVYSEKEITILFCELIKESHFSEAEKLLKQKQTLILSQLTQADLDSLILRLATSEIRKDIESIQNLIYFFLKNGANPITHLRLSHLSAFPIYGPIYEIFTKENLNQYNAEDLIYIIKDCAKTEYYHNKSNIIHIILNTKKDLLTKYFAENQETLDHLLFSAVKLKDDSIFLQLFNMGANPLMLAHHNKNALTVALNHQYYFAVKTILENKIADISANHLAIAFKTAVENKWMDLATLIASRRNIARKETIGWLLRSHAAEFINIILLEEPTDHELLLQLCQNTEIEIDKNESLSLFQHALGTHSADMLKAILTHHFQKIAPQRVVAAIYDLLEHQDNHFKDIIYIKCIEELKIPSHEKRDMALKIFLKSIQKADSIQDVLTITSVIKSNPAHFTYFNTLMNSEIKKITETAILRINEITKNKTELLFTKQELSDLLQFLDSTPGFRMFYNPKEDFMKLAKSKILCIEPTELVPQMVGN